MLTRGCECSVRGCKEPSVSSCISQQLQRWALLLLTGLRLLMPNDFGLSDVLRVIFPSLQRRYYNYFLRWTSKKKKKSPPKKESERKPRPVNRLRDTAYVCRKSAGRDNSYKWEALGKYYCPQMAKINLTGWMPGCERKLYKL